MHRKTKIIATLGPATSTPEAIEKLITRGMNVARLNFSHGEHQEHEARYTLVRRISSDMGVPVAVMQDIQGPKIRVGTFPGGSAMLETGSVVTLHPGSGDGDAENVYIAYLDDVAMNVGGRIVLSDGLIALEATDVKPDHITARVISGGELKDHKGASFPGATTRIPIVTAKDENDLS
ncbi:MAG: pyruvate kinase, partial [Actinomycetia bacterium]|nr:pyruvate kinase [Actinomycetes bacterium]